MIDVPPIQKIYMTAIMGILFGAAALIMFVPPWLYRFTIKSTAWFWWPLAFLGGDLHRARNPALFHFRVMGTLWARTTIVLSCITVITFGISLASTIHQQNPLLTPLGYLLVVDWRLQLWQVCAVAGSVLSLVIVFMIDYASREYRFAGETRDANLLRVAERKFGWIERVSRVRLLIVVLFWVLVGTHATLYFNGQRCWFSLTPAWQGWAQYIYGDRLPPDHCH
jgi:hypothetical protein